MSPDFAEMKTPSLIVAGDHDDSPLTVRGPDWFTEGYRLSPGATDLLTLFGAEHGLGGIHGYNDTRTTDESPERVAVIQHATPAYLRTALGLDGGAWPAVREALTATSDPLGSTGDGTCPRLSGEESLIIAVIALPGLPGTPRDHAARCLVTPLPDQPEAADGRRAARRESRRGQAEGLAPRTLHLTWRGPSASGSLPSPDDRHIPAPPAQHSPSSRTPGWPWRRPSGPGQRWVHRSAATPKRRGRRREHP
jgi:hypothetical protein